MENQAEIKVCRNCAHHAVLEGFVKGRSADACQHPLLRNPVTGESVDCDAVRSRHNNACGVKGLLFVRKHVADVLEAAA